VGAVNPSPHPSEPPRSEKYTFLNPENKITDLNKAHVYNSGNTKLKKHIHVNQSAYGVYTEEVGESFFEEGQG
jgi:hypothetical protein